MLRDEDDFELKQYDNVEHRKAAAPKLVIPSLAEVKTEKPVEIKKASNSNQLDTNIYPIREEEFAEVNQLPINSNNLDHDGGTNLQPNIEPFSQPSSTFGGYNSHSVNNISIFKTILSQINLSNQAENCDEGAYWSALNGFFSSYKGGFIPWQFLSTLLNENNVTCSRIKNFFNEEKLEIWNALLEFLSKENNDSIKHVALIVFQLEESIDPRNVFDIPHDNLYNERFLRMLFHPDNVLLRALLNFEMGSQSDKFARSLLEIYDSVEASNYLLVEAARVEINKHKGLDNGIDGIFPVKSLTGSFVKQILLKLCSNIFFDAAKPYIDELCTLKDEELSVQKHYISSYNY